MSYLCWWHDNDGDERGWPREEPELSCQACRAEALKWARRGGFRHFSLAQIVEYENQHPEEMPTTKVLCPICGARVADEHAMKQHNSMVHNKDDIRRRRERRRNEANARVLRDMRWPS